MHRMGVRQNIYMRALAECALAEFHSWLNSYLGPKCEINLETKKRGCFGGTSSPNGPTRRSTRRCRRFTTDAVLFEMSRTPGAEEPWSGTHAEDATDGVAQHSGRAKPPTRWCCFPGSGVRRDLVRRLACYRDDWIEPFVDRRAPARILAATVYIFFASALPAVAFGKQIAAYTGGRSFNIQHTLLSTGLCGALQALIGGQPLLIVGVAEPIIIVYQFMFTYCAQHGVDYVPWCAWACVWASLFLVITSIANACALIDKFTRFSAEVFGLLTALLFIGEAIKGLVGEFGVQGDPNLQTMNGVFSLLLAFLYVWSSLKLAGARRWRIGMSFVRAVFADYGPPLMIFALSGLSYALKGYDGVPQRITISAPQDSTWIASGVYTVLRMGDISGPQIAAAMVPGLVIAVLFYFDHSVSSLLAQQKDFNVTRPSAYHYDLMLLAVMTLGLGLVGLPPVNGVLPQAPLHTRSLCSKVKDGSGGAPRFKVHENRISNLCQALLCLVLFAFGNHILKYIPTCIIWGYFAYLSAESVLGSQFWDRMQIALTDPKRRGRWLKDSHALYLETVPFVTIVLFTAIQVTCLLVIWAITVWSGLFGISFPLWIMALVPLRLFVLPKAICKAHLDDLDGEEVEELPPGDAGMSIDARWFPSKEQDESAQDILNEYMDGMYIKHRITSAEFRARGGARREDGTLHRRHSIDTVTWL